MTNSRLPATPAPGYAIQRAEPNDEPALMRLLERFITTQDAARRYEWIYKRNPQGRAQAWLARELGRGQIVGFTSIFAREFSIAGQRVVAGIGFDAFVRPDHRRRGIALALHRASQAEMTSGDVPYRFMCGPPVPANLNALIKAGSRVVGSLRYLGLPLTVGGVLQMLHVRRHSERMGRQLARFDAVIAQIHRTINGARQTTVRPLHRVDGRFDRLWEELGPRFPVIGLRNAEYLDWRYLQNPVCQQQLVAIEQRGQLLGWAVLEFAPAGCLLVDYLLPLDLKSGGGALGALVDYVAGRGSSRLTLRFNLKGQYTRLFLYHGFLPGWSKEHLQILGGDGALRPWLFDLSAWHMTNGDLNPEASPWTINTAPEAEWNDPDYVCATWPPDSSAELLLDLQRQAQA